MHKKKNFIVLAIDLLDWRIFQHFFSIFQFSILGTHGLDFLGRQFCPGVKHPLSRPTVPRCHLRQTAARPALCPASPGGCRCGRSTACPPPGTGRSLGAVLCRMAFKAEGDSRQNQTPHCSWPGPTHASHIFPNQTSTRCDEDGCDWGCPFSVFL